MKKVVAGFLTVCMLAAALAGCGANNSAAEDDTPLQPDKMQVETDTKNPTPSEESKNETEQGDKEVAVGTILNAPEVVFDTNTEELYVYVTYPGDAEDEVLSMELAVDQVTADTYLIYFTDGLLKNHELVYEVTDAGVTKYYKDVFMSAFEQEMEASQQQLEEEKNEMLSLLGYFMMQNSDYAGYQFRKSDAPVFALTGEVYVYDMLENNECVGQICIDKATGLMVSLKDAQGNSAYTVQKFQTSNVEIPAYK